ncbi:hypothetical protein GO001_12080 [Streptomyces sp. NRRL B-1677]|uniref:hypothetical protein n=1 Tax=Streptomyces sp. NRRL B-1677 TaxID=2682966 RepID=UPI0018928F4C|nr:hypothetical protein [Streptomyces sp. NRRL B-1677]MBF6045958.1 hypothetical protein [Streptomyces sp. NRRL B-1677]
MSSPTAHASTGTQAMTAYHYITTVQTHDGLLNTRDGILDVPAGFTRAACFGHLLSQLTEEYSTPLAVLYFALEPNTLAAEAGQ